MWKGTAQGTVKKLNLFIWSEVQISKVFFPSSNDEYHQQERVLQALHTKAKLHQVSFFFLCLTSWASCLQMKSSQKIVLLFLVLCLMFFLKSDCVLWMLSNLVQSVEFCYCLSCQTPLTQWFPPFFSGDTSHMVHESFITQQVTCFITQTSLSANRCWQVGYSYCTFLENN